MSAFNSIEQNGQSASQEDLSTHWDTHVKTFEHATIAVVLLIAQQFISANRIAVETASLPNVASYMHEINKALSTLLVSVDSAAGCDKAPMIQVCDKLETQRQEMAWHVVERTATSPPDIRAKAMILREFVGEEKTDIADQLTQSLCDDILRLEAVSAA